MLINLIIIYFACGSPIGVYRITQVAHLRSPRQAAAVGAYFILWPIFAPAILRRSLLVHDTNIEQAIEIIRGALERLVFAESPPTISVSEFREVLSRYTGLRLAMKCAAARSSDEVFRITGHVNLSLASACIARRNHRRLVFHLARSRKEFIDLVTIAVRSSPKRTEVVDLCIQLAHLLNDKETAMLFGKEKFQVSHDRYML